MEISEVKDCQNQPKIKIHKSMEEEDRISMLPDCLLVDIIARLRETTDAIRTGTLSKRWQHLWTHVPNLTFINANVNRSTYDFFSFVDKTLTQCSLSNLIRVNLATKYDTQFESQVNCFIRYAVNRKVQDFNLRLWSRIEFEIHHGFFFTNSCFRDLFVLGCKFNPSGAINWSKLTTLHIGHSNLNEDFIENVLSGSPLLEYLALNKCYGFKRIDITSKSVKTFVFDGYWAGLDDVIEINAPYIVSLAIEDDMWLGKLSLLNVSSLVEAYLNYNAGEYDKTPCYEVEVEIFKGLILSLRHVKELEIGIFCKKVFSCLEAKGFIFPSNLKVGDWYEYDSDSDETGDSEELLLGDGHESEGDEELASVYYDLKKKELEQRKKELELEDKRLALEQQRLEFERQKKYQEDIIFYCTPIDPSLPALQRQKMQEIKDSIKARYNLEY